MGIDIENPGASDVVDLARLLGPVWPDGLAALDLTGATDNATELATYATWCASNGFDMILPRGATIGLASPLILPQGVGIDFNGATLKAMTGLSGGVLQLGVSGGGAYSYSAAGGIKDARIDCNEVTAAKGIHIVDARRTTIDNARIWKCVTHGIHLEAGYQVKVTNFEIIASSPHATTGGTTLAADAARGILCATSDCEFICGAVQHFYAAVEATSGNNNFAFIHAWSTYKTVDKKMHFGFISSGADNTFHGCVADSIRTVDNTNPPSTSNGGIAFLIPSASGNGVNNSLMGCSLYITSDGTDGTLPQNGSLLFAYIGKSEFSAFGCHVRDGAGSKIKSVAIEAVDSATARTAVIEGSGGLDAFMLQPNHIGTYASATPALNIGGSTTGIAYNPGTGLRTGTTWKVGPLTCFEAHMTLTSKGAQTGALTITGLSLGRRNFDGNAYAMCEIRNGPASLNARAKIATNSSTITLEDIDGTALDNTDIDDDTVIAVWGFVFSTFHAFSS